MGSALERVRQNAKHRELKLPESTRFAPITVVKVAVSTSGPIGLPSKSSSTVVPKHTITQKNPPPDIGSGVKHLP